MDPAFRDLLGNLRQAVSAAQAIHERTARLEAELTALRGGAPLPEPAAPAAGPAPLPGTPVAFPPGHFYSPIPNADEVRARAARIFDRDRDVPGVDLRRDAQLALLREFAAFYAEMPFTARPTPANRYWFENEMYSYGDALVFYSMLRAVRPPRVIEVGSGFSSAVLLDTNDLFLGGATQVTLIEPFPGDRLDALLRGSDRERVRVMPTAVQDVDPAVFDVLRSGDILFIDSTHVCKTGSDVNFLYFEILPRLAPGVVVHVHDIAFPFEYPEDWVYGGRAWNEAYLLRAFLCGNASYEIAYWNHMIALHHRAELERALPLALNNPGGSIWLRKIA